jgi:signal peptidase
MHKARIVVQSLVIAILFFVFAFNVFLIVARLVTNSDLPKAFGMAHVVVVTGSMEPTVNVGDILIIREQPDYAVGDIVTYRSGVSLVTHRIVAKQGDLLITRGDHNNVDDAPIPPESVEGKMIFRIPMLGKLSLLLRTRAGVFVTVFAGLILLALPLLSDRRKTPQ